MMAAAVFEAALTVEQATRLAELIRTWTQRRPDGVLEVRLYYDGRVGQLVSLWRNREALETYLQTAAVPRGTELMRLVGVEPEAVRVLDVLEASRS